MPGRASCGVPSWIGSRYGRVVADDVGKAGGAEAVEEALLGRDQKAVEGTGSGPGADVLVQYAAFFVVRAVDGNDDVVDRELVGRLCEAVAAARPGLGVEYAARTRGASACARTDAGASVARAIACRGTSAPSEAPAISSAARRP